MLSLLLVVVILTITTNLISTVGAPAINNLLWNLYTPLHSLPHATIQTSRTSFDSRAGMFRWVITVGFRMFLQFWFSRQPMFWIPQGWVPSVIEWGSILPSCSYGKCERENAPRVAQAGKKEL
ncbi:hypothetical protein BZA77DRAFT_320249 [Pyronema omphalodes]|nr:hypothetical protein BZA77DRAFT_320249 [Pyronema omphalodes]